MSARTARKALKGHSANDSQLAPVRRYTPARLDGFCSGRAVVQVARQHYTNDSFTVGDRGRSTKRIRRGTSEVFFGTCGQYNVLSSWSSRCLSGGAM
jgi:hypothetical protein